MINNKLSFEYNARSALHYIGESIEKLDHHYLIIWFGFLSIATIIVIIFRSVPSNGRINRFTTAPKNESITTIEKEEKLITAVSDNVKYRVMIDHTKSLRELYAASERCYIKKNALKCIQIVSYCPHLINVQRGVFGMTPFHNVCYHGHTCLISYMLAKGANPWLTTVAGETALCLAIQACIKNPEKPLTSLECLQQHGCYLDYTNKWYKIYLEAVLLTNNRSLARWMFDQAPLLGTRCGSYPLTRI